MKTIPVVVNGEIQLYDIYINDVWHGSARTLDMCNHYYSQVKK